MSVRLQGVQHFKDIQYTPSMTYGELFMQNEYEMSCYNLDEANVEGQRQRFHLYQQVCCLTLLLKAPIMADVKISQTGIHGGVWHPTTGAQFSVKHVISELMTIA